MGSSTRMFFINRMCGLIMTTYVWKNDYDSYSAVRDDKGKIEVLIDGKNWGYHSGAKARFRFGDQDAMMGLEMLDELERYISSEGEWPDWHGAKNIEGKDYVLTLEKHGHDWQNPTGWLEINGTIGQMHFSWKLGIKKAIGFYCAAIEIEELLD